MGKHLEPVKKAGAFLTEGIAPCGAKLYEVFDILKVLSQTGKHFVIFRYNYAFGSETGFFALVFPPLRRRRCVGFSARRR